MEPKGLRLGERLVSKGFLTMREVEEGLRIQALYPRNLRLGKILWAMGEVTEDQLGEALREGGDDTG